VNVRLERPQTQPGSFLKGEGGMQPISKIEILFLDHPPPFPHNHHLTTTKLYYPSSAYGTLEFSKFLFGAIKS
jgi:hypothetical protein